VGYPTKEVKMVLIGNIFGSLVITQTLIIILYSVLMYRSKKNKFVSYKLECTTFLALCLNSALLVGFFIFLVAKELINAMV